jgi:hypothetical protein
MSIIKKILMYQVQQTNMAISLRKIDQSDHYISCFDGKTKEKGKGKVI